MNFIFVLRILGFCGAVFAMGCDAWYCDEPNWCEGNSIWGCRLPDDYDDHNWAETSAQEKARIKDCAAFDKICVANSSDAKCVWKDKPCEEDKSAYCDSGILKTCFAGFLSSEEKCADHDSYCMENPNANGTEISAVCSDYAEGCSEDGENSCKESETATGQYNIVVCNKFYWSDRKTCHGDSVCVVTDDDDEPGAECTLSATPCASGVQSMCVGPLENKLADCSTGFPVYHQTCFDGCIQISATQASCQGEDTQTK